MDALRRLLNDLRFLAQRRISSLWSSPMCAVIGCRNRAGATRYCWQHGNEIMFGNQR